VLRPWVLATVSGGLLGVLLIRLDPQTAESPYNEEPTRAAVYDPALYSPAPETSPSTPEELPAGLAPEAAPGEIAPEAGAALEPPPAGDP
jgi:hypothetical protein